MQVGRRQRLDVAPWRRAFRPSNAQPGNDIESALCGQAPLWRGTEHNGRNRIAQRRDGEQSETGCVTSSHPLYSQIPTLVTCPPALSQLVNELNRGEMHGFGETLFMKEVCSMQSDDIDTVREPPLTIQQATSLVELFVAGESFAFLFDHPLVSETLRDAVAPGSGRAGNDPLAILRHPRADVYALIIRFCTTALVSIPHSYAITLGLVNSHNELPDVIFQLDREAQRALVTMKHPTFELLQALNLAALSLASR